MINTEFKYIAIDDLVINKKISVRAANSFKQEKFLNLYDIIFYYLVHNSFLKIYGIGEKTDLELSKFCEECLSEEVSDFLNGIESSTNRYKSNLNKLDYNDRTKQSDYNNNTAEETTGNVQLKEFLSLLEIREETKDGKIKAISNIVRERREEIFLRLLSDTQKRLLTQRYNEQKHTLSRRAKTALANINFESFVKDFLFAANTSFLKIKNIGRKSVAELVDLRNSLIREVFIVSAYSEATLSDLIVRETKADLFVDEYVDKFYDKHKHFPMFRVIEHYLKTSSYRDVQILLRSFPFFKDCKVYQLSEIANEFNFTRERVRQIKNKMFLFFFDLNNKKETTKKDLKLIKGLISNTKDWEYLKKIVEKTYLISSEKQIKNILELEKSNLTEQFALQLMKCVFGNKVTLFNGLSIEKHDLKWKNTYLIPSYLAAAYDFQKAKQYLEEYIENNVNEQSINIQEYVTVSDYWTKYNISYEKQVVTLIRDILINEHEIFPYDTSGVYVTIPALKEKHPFDVIYEIFKEKGEPMHLDEIFDKFKERLPFHKYTEAEQIRHYILRSEKITHIHRESLYTLKEWRKYRTGTIRDAVIEFLEKHKAPQDYDSITEYVIQFYPRTYKASIKSSIKQDTRNRFVFYEHDLVGLASQKYSPEYRVDKYALRSKKNVEQRITELEKFIVKNQHFPFVNSSDRSERTLYRWLTRVLDGTVTLTESQAAEIKRIQDKFKHLNVCQFEYEWYTRYSDYLAFLSTHKRKPDEADGDGVLFNWYKVTLDSHRAFELNPNQRVKLIKLMKTIDVITR